MALKLNREKDIWVKVDGDIATGGLTKQAARKITVLGTFKKIDVPTGKIKRGEIVAIIEAGKTVVEIESPLSGQVTDMNEQVKANPRLLSNDPMGEGWLFKIKISDKTELSLLSS